MSFEQSSWELFDERLLVPWIDSKRRKRNFPNQPPLPKRKSTGVSAVESWIGLHPTDASTWPTFESIDGTFLANNATNFRSKSKCTNQVYYQGSHDDTTKTFYKGRQYCLRPPRRKEEESAEPGRRPSKEDKDPWWNEKGICHQENCGPSLDPQRIPFHSCLWWMKSRRCSFVSVYGK